MLNTTIVPNNIERVEVIYDMNSTDPAINFGLPGGITDGMVIGLDLSKYKMLRCQYQSYNKAIVAFGDLTTPAIPHDPGVDVTGRYVIYAVIYDGSSFDEIISEVDLEKKHFTASYLPGRGTRSVFISKIEGIY